uniref:Uncharacterized protein n=1 Tax=uncultured marine virus TaxID=186617 RepID=A0A0F7L192_9VIRU|nr:hypothetical protein [uncultured marine virus]
MLLARTTSEVLPLLNTSFLLTVYLSHTLSTSLETTSMFAFLYLIPIFILLLLSNIGCLCISSAAYRNPSENPTSYNLSSWFVRR